MNDSRISRSEFGDDTIAAIATPIGTGAIGVVRISGDEAVAAAERVFRSRSGALVSQFSSHTVHLGFVVDPSSEQIIDECLLTLFRAPSSYTGEDVVEISCHGGASIVAKVLEAVLSAGVRMAEPGEFTKRAFLNGRLDLAQAEAVNDIIRAHTDEARRLALRQLFGALSREVREISDKLMSILSRVSASVDFPEDVPEPDYLELSEEIANAVSELDRLIATSRRGCVYREGITLAIVGRPNVGKSSLLNALLRRDRAIVTDIPGTTRDTIEEVINIRGVPVIAIDTAGIRKSPDEIERIGIKLTEQTIESAEIVLVVVDASDVFSDEDFDIIRRVGSRAVVVLNKMDIVSDDSVELAAREACARLGVDEPAAVSAKTGFGIDGLEDKIASTALGTDLGFSEGAVVASTRHRNALVRARECLSEAVNTLKSNLPIDLISGDVQAAIGALGEITGETAASDLIDRIFSEFCIGK